VTENKQAGNTASYRYVHQMIGYTDSVLWHCIR